MQSRILLVALCTLSSAAAFAAAACSNNDTSSTPTEDGGAGGDGSATTDSGGGTGDGGTTEDSGFSNQDSGPVDAGPCGNEHLLAADGGFRPSCATCLQDKCCAQVKACEGNPDCAEFATCFAECELSKPGDAGSNYCTAKCAQGKDASALSGMQSVYNALILCGGNSCHEDGGASAPQCPF